MFVYLMFMVSGLSCTFCSLGDLWPLSTVVQWLESMSLTRVLGISIPCRVIFFWFFSFVILNYFFLVPDVSQAVHPVLHKGSTAAMATFNYFIYFYKLSIGPIKFCFSVKKCFADTLRSLQP